MIITFIFLVLLILIRIVTGIRLLALARRNRLPNLVWLSASMFVTAGLLLFAPAPGNPLGNLPISLWIFTIGALAGEIFLVMFNQNTFYKDRKSPVAWIWIFLIACGMVSIYGVFVSESNNHQSVWVAAHIFVATLIWAWHGGLASQALARVKAENSVQDWVKTRYRLIVLYSIVLMIGSVASASRFLFINNETQPVLDAIISAIGLITQIASVTLMFLVWVMPEQFRLWLNRNQQKRVDERVYTHASAILDILGTGMSSGTNLPKTLALVSIRRMISRQINTEDSKKIESHVVKLGYDDWYSFLEQPELSVFLKEVANVNPNNVLKNAKNTLIENQSLFTIQAQ